MSSILCTIPAEHQLNLGSYISPNHMQIGGTMNWPSAAITFHSYSQEAHGGLCKVSLHGVKHVYTHIIAQQDPSLTSQQNASCRSAGWEIMQNRNLITLDAMMWARRGLHLGFLYRKTWNRIADHPPFVGYERLQ